MTIEVKVAGFPSRYGGADTANELLFQFQFAIGAHGAHPF